ncbi:MAG: AAA family ATPase [Clostridia bacterium]|nr:AAA family ATPase [Clostridia bacterium]
MIFRENYVKKIMAFTDTTFVKVLTGVRRCGKSTIMQMIMDELRKRDINDERIVSYRFDSMEYEGMTAKQLYEMIKTKLSDTEKTYLFLDEVQKITSWEKTEKREYDRLLEINDNYPKYLLRADDFAGGNYQGIKTMHVANFLLSKEY